jgi:hypothetical protein
MTIRPRAVRAAIAARTKMRDLAAAANAQAQSADQEAKDAEARAAAELDQAIADAHARMATSGSVAELCRIADELEADRAGVNDAVKVRATAAAALEKAVQTLQQRERQLRTVERALDVIMDHKATGVARAEQQLTDDLNNRRRDS